VKQFNATINYLKLSGS